jgi:predicted hydrocarbon binding protein
MRELPVPVDYEPETGRWSVDGQPMILMPRHYYVFIQMEMEKRFGAAVAAELLRAAAARAARLWCEREAKTHGLGGVEVFRHYLKRLSERGYGKFAIEAIDRAGASARIRLEHSCYALEYGAAAGRKTCYAFGGMFEGAMAYLAAPGGGPAPALDARETQCRAEGAECCRFDVHPARS